MKQHYSDFDDWRSLPLRHRCGIVAATEGKIAEAAEELTRLCNSQQRVDPVETITAELLPLCAALRFIKRRGAKVLRDQHHRFLGRPTWLWGVHSFVRREPYGRVLILGTWNYPLLLPGVQAAQALAAGNTVLLKPAVGCERVTERMVRAFHEAGVPQSQLRQLDSHAGSAIAAIEEGVDLIVLTGATATGRDVLKRAAESLTPTIMELSGCDAVIVMPDTDLDRAADAIVFGLNFNSGATCIGPRRLVIEKSMADRLCDALCRRLESSREAIVHPTAREATADLIVDAINYGCVDLMSRFDADQLRRSGTLRPIVLDQVDPSHPIANADIFAPLTSIIRVDRIAEAIQIVNACPYRLAASVFGPRAEAIQMADRLQVGSVVINDLIVPTADPRLPFGGRGQSGFGVTRGSEGMLAMSVPKVTSERRRKSAAHLRPRQATDAQTLIGALQLLHSERLPERLRALAKVVWCRHAQPEDRQPPSQP